VAYTFTVFLKANGRAFAQITCNTGQVTGNPRVNYDLASVSTGSVDASATASIAAYPDGWRRLSFTITAAGTVLNFLVSAVTSSTAARFESFAGDTTKGFYIWGYSVEQGAFPTSYIPTTTTALTRPVDSAVIDGTGVITGTYTLVEKPAGCAVVNGTNIDLVSGFTAERVMVFPAALSAPQITAIRGAM
jgi:hypothetical protein